MLAVVFAIVSTFAFNYQVSLPKLADERWGGEGRFGLVLSVTSVGALIGSLLTARLPSVTMRWFLGSTVVLGLAGTGPGLDSEPRRGRWQSACRSASVERRS